MSHPPSRSEIESALSGKTKKTPYQAKPKPSFDLGEPPRRQQVLGGDLSGVNQTKKYGLFSRYSDINIAAWVGGFVIVLIFVAFFWPEQPNSVTEISKELDENRIVAVEDQDLDDAVAGQANFSRDTDFDRANEFREQDALDNQVRELLQTAAAHIRKRELTQPPEKNAVLIYKEVLSLSPNNADAKEGLGKIRQHFLVRGLNSLEADKPVLARSYLDRLAIIDAESEDYAELKAAFDEFNVQQDIRSLLKKANQAVAANKLILPARESALAYFQQVLELAPENSKALTGIKKIADGYIEQASSSVLSGDYDAAAARLATVALIDPEHKSIALVEAMIKNAKSVAQQRQQEEQASNASENGAATQASTPTTNQATSSEPTEPTQIANTNISNTEDDTTSTPVVNSNKTPAKQADEQKVFDQQYLQQGLSAYYSGDYDKAASLLEPLADKGIARAQMRLAYMHFLGRGYLRNRTEADRIVRAALPSIRKFADEGRGWAQSDLGSLYEDGLVLPRDYGEAVYWYRTAAEKGYPGAQTNLGIMYARGRGVAASRRTAIEWFQRAAKQGDDVAKRNLDALGVTN